MDTPGVSELYSRCLHVVEFSGDFNAEEYSHLPRQKLKACCVGVVWVELMTTSCPNLLLHHTPPPPHTHTRQSYIISVEG